MPDPEGNPDRKPKFGDVFKKRKIKRLPPLEQGMLLPPELSEFNLPINLSNKITYTDVVSLAKAICEHEIGINFSNAMKEAARQLDFDLKKK